jgi:hypothetical protein
MPLTMVEFDLHCADLEIRREVVAIHDFLKARAELAYSASEVADAMGQDPAEVRQILHKLDDLDLVQIFAATDECYFRYRSDLPYLDVTTPFRSLVPPTFDPV